MMGARINSLRLLIAALAAGLLLALSAGATPAHASSAWWLMNMSSAPTKLVPGQKAQLFATAVDNGYAPVTGATTPVVLTDVVPAGLKIGKILTHAAGPYTTFKFHEPINLECTTVGQTVSCPLKAEIQPAENVRVQIEVEVESTLEVGTKLTNKAHIEGGTLPGGGEPPTAQSSSETLEVSNERTPFGVEAFQFTPENANGTLDTQAGSHPFQMTTTFNLQKDLELYKGFTGTKELAFAGAQPKNLHFVLPPGLIGSVAELPQCSGADFTGIDNGKTNYCPSDTAIGFATVTLDEPASLGTFTQEVPLFNLTPSEGEPARFGFVAHTVPVVLTTHVRSGTDYGVEASVELATQAAEVLNSQVTFWGVPGDPRHDEQRGWECIGAGYLVAQENRPCVHLNEKNPRAFLTMPTSCEGTPKAEVKGEAWTDETVEGVEKPITLKETFTFPAFEGCGALKLEPTIEVQPDKHEAASPSGFTVTIKVPQEGTVSGKEGALAESAIRSTTLALPPGVEASGGAANGLATCTSKGFGFAGFEPIGGEAPLGALTQNNEFNQSAVNTLECPDASKIGTVSIVSPLLEEELKGTVYLASEDTNPFGSPLVLYIFAETPTSHVQVKLAGEVKPDEHTGQLVSVFKNTPPVAFSELKLHLFNGERAAQSTPETCGTFTSAASFEGWSEFGKTVPASSQFTISSEPGGGPCTSSKTSQPFAPGFQAGSESSQAGAFSPFIVNLERPDGQQALKTISVHLPLGAAAMLSSVNPCPIDQARADSCPAESKVGHSVAVAGLGANPVTIAGEVYLTSSPGPGVPFGLMSVTDASKVGPFNLGHILVLSGITVNETTAQATVTSEPLPQFVKGVPSQIKRLSIVVNRENFTFNPTNCGNLETTATLTGYGPAGTQGVANVPSPYHAANCASLPFAPTLSVETESSFSRVDGLGLKVMVTSAKGQANIGKTKLVFPTALPSRLTTIQKACPDQVFNANPANCPEGSVIGTATAHTPVLKAPLTGPAYLVSHASASFPDAEFVLQGEGIKLVLDGKTDIKKGITSSTFETVPDAPVETFEVNLPRGPHSAFSGFGDLCAKPLELPTEFVGQNGALIKKTTIAKLKGCVASFKAKETELTKLLKVCKEAKKHSTRVKCEATAHKRYKAMQACKKKNKSNKKKLASCQAQARRKYVLKTK